MKRLFLSLALALGIFAIPLPSFATVQFTGDKKIYQGDGYSTSFSFPYNIYLATDLAVYETVSSTTNTTQLTLNTNYSVTLTAIPGVTGAYTATINLAGGSSPAGALAVGTQLTILRSLPLTQLINISDYSATPAATWNQALDRSLIIEQQLQEQINRSLLAPVGSTSGTQFPTSSPGTVIGWNSLGGLANFIPNTGAYLTTSTDGTLSANTDSLIPTQKSVKTYVDNAIVINVKGYGATGNGVTDDTAAINSAFAAIPSSGGTLYFPAGTYLTSSMITVPSNVNIIGSGGRGNGGNLLAPGSSIILGQHTGNAVLSLIGSYGVKISGINIQGSSSKTPKTGMLLARSVSNGNAGDHTFRDLGITGYYSLAGVYSVASEDNRWYDLQIIIAGGGALYGFYTSQSDGLAIGGIGGGSNQDNSLYGFIIGSYVNNPSCAAIFMDTGALTRDWNWNSGYLTGVDGNYVKIGSYETDNQDTPGPISFTGVAGERTSGALMENGFYVTSFGGTATIYGINILNCRFDLQSSGHFFNQVDSNLSISDSMVKIPYNSVNSGSTSVWRIALLKNCYIDEGFGTTPTQYGGLKVVNGNMLTVSGSNPNIGIASLDASNAFLDFYPGPSFNAFIDNNSIGGSTIFRTSVSTALDTIALTIFSSGDVYTNAWQDYSASSTIVGWGSFTTKLIYYKKVGKTVFVQFNIQGTSNSTTTSFTLPYASALTTAIIYPASDNGGSYVAAQALFPVSSSTIAFYANAGAASAWTSSGTKTIIGEFWYQSS